MNQKCLKQSSKWDHIMSLDDLLKDVDEVYVDLCCRSHTISNGFRGVCMYIPHSSTKDYTIISICDDGFVYEGDGYPIDRNPFKFGEVVYKMKVNDAIQVMELWSKCVIAAEKLEHKLASIKNVNTDCVCIKISNFHK